MCITILVDDALDPYQGLLQSVLVSVSMRVGDFLDPCRKNLGPHRDLFLPVLVSITMRVDDALGPCRKNLGPHRDLFLSVLVNVLARVAECLGQCHCVFQYLLVNVSVGVDKNHNAC